MGPLLGSANKKANPSDYSQQTYFDGCPVIVKALEKYIFLID